MVLDKIQLLLKFRDKKSGEVLFNVLTRTSGRPRGFKLCRESITNQTYKNVRHLVSYDRPEDLEYVEQYDVDKLRVDYPSKPGKKEAVKGLVYEHYNLYCNDLLAQVESGWILFLDDDDMLLGRRVLKKLARRISRLDEDTLIIFQTRYPNGKLLPEENFMEKNKIELYHIDTACFAFHSKYKEAAKWDGWRTADYRFLKDLSLAVPKQYWIKEPLTQKNNFGDLGQRNDIKLS